MAALTSEAIRQAGLDALRRELGVVGMIRFLQQFESGQGDYTVDRWQWLAEGTDVKSLATAVRESAREQNA